MLIERSKLMDNTIVNIVSTLGFPISMCVGACFFIKYLFDTFTKQITEMQKEHKEEVSSMNKAIENNTLILTKLCEKLDKE